MFQVIPRPGLARLKAARSMEVHNIQDTWANTDPVFLSSLVCIGMIGGPTALTSLTGLDNVVDGVIDASLVFIESSDSQPDIT